MMKMFLTFVLILGTELNHCSYQHPIYVNKNSLPFFDASHVQETKGTGLVHTAPAHGPDDFLVCLAKKITVVSNFIKEPPLKFISNMSP